SLDTSVAAGGIGSLGASLKFASVVAGGDSWFGLDGSGISGSLIVALMTVTLTLGTTRLNLARGNASKLDWSTLDTTGLELPHLNVTSSIDLEVGGKLTVDVPLAGTGTESLTVTGAGSFVAGEVSDTDSGQGNIVGDHAHAV